MFVNDELKSYLETSPTITGNSVILAEWNMNISTNIFKAGNYRYRPASNPATEVYSFLNNSFDPIDEGYFYTKATDADVVVDGGLANDNLTPISFSSPAAKEEMLYSLEDCLSRFRPRSGINKARFFENKFLHHANIAMARRPRYYLSSKDDSFKYWTSYRNQVVYRYRYSSGITGFGENPTFTDNNIEQTIKNGEPVRSDVRGVADTTLNGLNFIDDTAPFVVYKEPVPANRVVVKMQTSVGSVNLGPFSNESEIFEDPFFGYQNQTTPSKWKIQYLDDENIWIDLIKFDENSERRNGERIIGPDGYVEISYGLIIPDRYKPIFVKVDELSSVDLLPEQQELGYSYLVKHNDLDLGEYYIWTGSEYETFTPTYGWDIHEEGLESITNVITQPVKPKTYFDSASNKETLKELMFIKGLRVVVETMNVPGSTFDLIELSPRMVIDISDISQQYSVQKSASDLGVSGMPVGQLIASTGGLSIFDYQQAFNENNKDSIISKYINKSIQIKFFEKIVAKNGVEFFVPIKTMYSEGFPEINSSSREVQIQLRDLFFYFESLSAPELLIPNVSLSSAVSMLLDSVGFSNYVFKRVPGEVDPIIPFFFVNPETSLAEVLEQLALSTQTAMFFDEFNNFVMMTKDYIMPSKEDRDTDIILYGSKDQIKQGTRENQNSQDKLANIIDISSQNTNIYNDGTINYITRYIQRSYGSVRQASMIDREKTWIYKPVLLWEVSPTEQVRSSNNEQLDMSNFVLSAIPLNSDLSDELPKVVNNEIVNNTIDLGEGVYWVSRYNGYFYANGEIIKYDAVEYSVAGVGDVWITSTQEYDNYFSSIPFNGKIYPTGLIRIYSEPNFETFEGEVRLANGPVAKHGRKQFGTKIVNHFAGLSPYWSDNDNVGGCLMESKYLFEKREEVFLNFANSVQENAAISIDGVEWEESFLPREYWTDIAFGKDVFVAVANVPEDIAEPANLSSGYLSFSNDAKNWTNVDQINPEPNKPRIFTQNATSINTTSGLFNLQSPPHGYLTGDMVRYDSTTPAGGLTPGTNYFIRLQDNANPNTATTFFLHATKTAALAGTGTIIPTGVGSGTATFEKLENRGLNSVTFGIDAEESIVQNSLAINTTTNTITTRFNHNFETGDGVLYTAQTPADGLQTGNEYFIQKTGPKSFILHPTKKDAESTIPKNFIVTVKDVSGANKYSIDGEDRPSLTLYKGVTYTFNQSDTSNANHKIYLSGTEDGIHGGGQEYTPGVTYTGTAGTNGSLVFKVPDDAPDTLYYVGLNDSGMGVPAKISIESYQTINITNRRSGNATFSRGKFVAVGEGIVVYSQDGKEWKAGAIPDLSWTSVVYGNNSFVAISQGGNVSATSSFGESWVTSQLPEPAAWSDIAFGLDQQVSINQNAFSISLNNNSNVNNRNLITTLQQHGFVTGDLVQYRSENPASGTLNNEPTGLFDKELYYVRVRSATSFTLHRTAEDAEIDANRIVIVSRGSGIATFSRNKFLAVTTGEEDSDVAAKSFDGKSWTLQTIPSGQWSSITYGRGQWVAVSGSGGKSINSVNGTLWSLGSLPSTNFWSSVTFGDNLFLAVTRDSGESAYSKNGIVWTGSTLPKQGDTPWIGLTYGIDKKNSLSQNNNTIIRSNNQIVLPEHSFRTGELVQYTALSPAGGLSSESFYYVKQIFVGNEIASSRFSLHTTKAAAISGTSPVNITSSGSGLAFFTRYKFVAISRFSSPTKIRVESTENIKIGDSIQIAIQIGNNKDFQTLSRLGDTLVVEIINDKDFRVNRPSRFLLNNNTLLIQREPETELSNPTTPAGKNDVLARQSFRNGIIKNFLSSAFQSESDAATLYSTQTGTIQSSALVFTGPPIPGEVAPRDFVSYINKPLEDRFRHFGTRMRIIGKIENEKSKGQSPVGSTTYYPVTPSNTEKQANLNGSSGGLAVMINPETNNGYFFEIIALTDTDVNKYSQPVDSKTIDESKDFSAIYNVIFYKVLKDKETSAAIPIKLWAGLSNILVDEGSFVGQQRMFGEDNPTVYDLAVEYTDNFFGNTRRFFLYINGKIVATVDDPDPLPTYPNMALFVRGSSRVMFENVYALTNNYSQNTTFSIDTPVNSIFIDDEVNANDSFNKYALTGIVQSAYLSGISTEQPPSYNIYFEEFGTIMREAVFFDIKYDKAFPALTAELSPTFTKTKGYSVSQFRPNSYGAQFIVFNATDTALNLDESSGNYLRIQGITFTQQSPNELTVDEYFQKHSDFSNLKYNEDSTLISPFRKKEEYQDIRNSRTTYGRNEFVLDSAYIQNEDYANELMGWMINKVSVPRKSVGVRIFSNPMIQLGDVVQISYKDLDGVNAISPDSSRFIVYSIEFDRDQNGPGMTLFLSEVT